MIDGYPEVCFLCGRLIADDDSFSLAAVICDDIAEMVPAHRQCVGDEVSHDQHAATLRSARPRGG
jgi:hypothetical protein